MITATTFNEFIQDQLIFQRIYQSCAFHPPPGKQAINAQYKGVFKEYDIAKDYTTVGFEVEFADFRGALFQGCDHIEVAQSEQRWPINHLPFILETDTGSVLELQPSGVKPSRYPMALPPIMGKLLLLSYLGCLSCSAKWCKCGRRQV